jgi:hypothetical protein
MHRRYNQQQFLVSAATKPPMARVSNGVFGSSRGINNACVDVKVMIVSASRAKETENERGRARCDNQFFSSKGRLCPRSWGRILSCQIDRPSHC